MRYNLLATAVLTVTALLAPAPRWSAADSPEPSASIAAFERGFIDLRQGWGEANACASDGVETECFRTEEEMDRYLASQTIGAPTRVSAMPQSATQLSDDVTIQATCSTTVRLYQSTFFGGGVLALSTRGVVLNLATWSFSNVTSSYKIGACSATFYDGANATPPVYPGGTWAGASATVMLSGWDNRLSSIYIN